MCEIGFVLREASELFLWLGPVARGGQVAQGVAVCLHERVKRSAAGPLADPTNVLRSCPPCNTWIEDNPGPAWMLGLSLHGWEKD